MRAIVLASTALLAFPLAAQTVAERLDKARTEVNTVENAAARAQTAIKAGNLPKATLEINATKNAASRALYAIDKAIEAVAPTPTPTPTPTVSLTGAPPIASNFDTATVVQPSWGTGQIPGSAAPDVMGAFRFICGAGQLSYDDPIMFPGQPGKSHLHQYFGNTAADAHSTYASLRAKGGSTCNQSTGDPYAATATAANRSAYWMPAMLDGKGNVVRPDLISIYYKQVLPTHPACKNAAGENICINIPNAIRFIYGWDPTGVNSAKTGTAYFNCQGPTAKPGHYPDLTGVKDWCGPGNQLGAVITAPTCWDGKNLDSPDHRSHVAYECSAKHPYRFPEFSQGVWYTVGPNDDPSLWELSSDHMAPGKPKGYTFHSDYFEGWDPPTKAIWWENCLLKLRNASGGDLCNGKQLKGANQPWYYVSDQWGTGYRPVWTHPQAKVPVPLNPS